MLVLAGMTLGAFAIGYLVNHWGVLLLPPVLTFVGLGLGMLEGDWEQLHPDNMLQYHMDELFGALGASVALGVPLALVALFGMRLRGR